MGTVEILALLIQIVFCGFGIYALVGLYYALKRGNYGNTEKDKAREKALKEGCPWFVYNLRTYETLTGLECTEYDGWLCTLDLKRKLFNMDRYREEQKEKHSIELAKKRNENYIDVEIQLDKYRKVTVFKEISTGRLYYLSGVFYSKDSLGLYKYYLKQVDGKWKEEERVKIDEEEFERSGGTIIHQIGKFLHTNFVYLGDN